MTLTPIYRIQGSGLLSEFVGLTVRTRGVVTGHSHKGFFVQDPSGAGAEHLASDGLFVFARRTRPPLGAFVEVGGKIVDFAFAAEDRPTTQLVLQGQPEIITDTGPPIEPTWLTVRELGKSMPDVAAFLNAHEGMVCGVRAGATFIAPSNPFGDYLLLPEDIEARRTRHDGVLIDPRDPHRWYPSLRVLDYETAPPVHVGAKLTTAVTGPLNYRVGAFQIVATGPRLGVDNARVIPELTRLRTGGPFVTVLTLNGFNLDPKIEDPDLVQDPRRDVDDDVGDQRYRMLARAIAEQAGGPDVIALQEIQDNDGAEISEVTAASRTLTLLTRAVRKVGGPRYRWADAPPTAHTDGGQPGGNIRNAFLYNPDRVELLGDTLQRLGEVDEVFEDSRKPVLAMVRLRQPGGKPLAIVNVHLASKRHQFSVFAPERPGFDPRNDLRVRQAGSIRGALHNLARDGIDAYVTGDFNDFEFSDTLRSLTADDYTNLVHRVAPSARYDYNHRGISQALMHGIVSSRFANERKPEYEILHGNDLIGVQPGTLGGKATDHAYVLAKLDMR